MNPSEPNPHLSLEALRVAVTGRLAFMTRPEAIALIEEHGGIYVKTVSSRTAILVVGRNGWPLANDGRLTRSIDMAQHLRERGVPIEILGEETFLSRLGLAERGDGVKRLYTLEQLARILNVAPRRVRSWIRADLIRPVRTVHRLCYFDFRQVASAKALSDLLRSGLPPAKLRTSLEQLRRWIPDAGGSLAQLDILEQGSAVLMRLPDGRLAEPSGQLHIDFGEPGSSAPSLRLPSRPSDRDRPPPDWFAIAVRSEEAGDLGEAATAYHRALLAEGPQPELAFNLGNVLYGMWEREAAAQRFLQAVELDCRYVEAWNNLGIVLGQLGRTEQAREALETALALEPGYADAHFNLGVVLEQMGCLDEAREHWRAYLRHDPSSSWARRLRARLEESSGCESTAESTAKPTTKTSAANAGEMASPTTREPTRGPTS